MYIKKTADLRGRVLYKKLKFDMQGLIFTNQTNGGKSILIYT